jgi:hypothetical protein
MDDYLNASLLGAFRAAVLMPIEQPLDYIKTQIQSSFYRGSPVAFIKNHVTKHGFLKLYTGFFPNLARACLKQSYRLPLMVYVPNVYRRYSSDEHKIQIATGISLAILESYLMCPLERIKIWLMTAPEPGFKYFYHYISGVKDLYIGAVALLYRQTLSWITFLGFTSLFKESILKQKGSIDYYDTLYIGAMVGLVNTTVIMPVDFIKTHKQKFKELGDRSFIETLKHLTKGETLIWNKIMTVYSGWRVRTFHYFINSFATLSLVDKLERMYSTRYTKKN